MDTEIESEAYSNLTDIQQFYYGKSVFITGVTGLVGKVVLEKLLRSCPGIGMVYVHLRAKKGLTAQQRLEKIFKLELFKDVKEIFPLFWKKVQVIEGNISEKRLGISFEDYEKIRQNVSIVIHCAASVSFTDPLNLAAAHNLKAAQDVLDLCRDMPNIKAVVHVSTAFVKRETDGSVLEEVPKTKISPQQLLDALEWMDENTQNALSDYLTEKKILTTYLVTKALAEVCIDEERGDLPVAIVRPAYIGPTCKDPFPGWIDQLQGVSGLLLAGAKGVLRTIESVKGFKASVVPVDIVSNVIILSAWHVGVTRPAPLFIVNAVFDYEKLPSCEEFFLPPLLRKREEYPLVKMFRYPDITLYNNKFAFKLHSFIDHWIPAAIVDLLLFLFTGRTILMKVYTKIFFLYDIFFRLGKDPWICRRENLNFLRDSVSEKDAEMFWIDMENFDWLLYMDHCLQGGRKFIAREDPSNIPYAKKKAKIWWAVTTTLKWFLILYFLYYLFTRSFFSSIYESFEEKLFKVYS